MGTRSLTFVVDNTWNSDKKPLATIYRQMDGYPEGHGKELFDAVGHLRVVNGYGFGDKLGVAANGAGCLAAQLIKALKDDIGGIYLQESPDDYENPDDRGQEYTYTLIVDSSKGAVRLIVNKTFGKQAALYDGPLSAFGEWLKNMPEDEAEET